MPALPITALEAALGATVRAKLDDALKLGTSGSLTLPGPIALTALPGIVLDLYEIAFLAGLQALAGNTIPPTNGVPLPSFVKTGLPAAAGKTGFMIFVSNETGGAVPAFSDGTNWRRVTDRAIVS
jgi:hypothetical protein